MAQAEQALATAKAALGYTSLVSPVDGVVVAVNVSAGTAAPSGAAITVRSLGLQVAATVTESDLPSIALGQEATVTITAFDTDVTGTVERIDQTPASSNTGVVELRDRRRAPGGPDGHRPRDERRDRGDDRVGRQRARGPGDRARCRARRDVHRAGARRLRPADLVPVQVGLITSSLAEVTGGIVEGTAVVTGTASDRTSSGTTTTTGIPGLGGGLGGGGAFPGGFPGRQP